MSVYLRLRDRFPNSLLLESSDYHANDNSFSYICCNPIASIKIENETVTKLLPDNSSEILNIEESTDIPKIIQGFSESFEADNSLHFKFYQ